MQKMSKTLPDNAHIVRTVLLPVKHFVGPLDVLGDLYPVVHGHVARVQEGVVLVDGVDDPPAQERRQDVTIGEWARAGHLGFFGQDRKIVSGLKVTKHYLLLG